MPEQSDSNFEMLPIRSEDAGFIDRLLASNPEFRQLMEDRRKEVDAGQVSSLEAVRKRLDSTQKS